MKDFTLGTMYWINPLASQEEILGISPTCGKTVFL